MSDLSYWLALNEYPKFGPRAMARLAAHFSSMQKAFDADASELAKAGIHRAAAEGFVHMRDEIQSGLIARLMKKHSVSAININDPNYPPLLKQIYDPPAVLYYWGALPSPEIGHLAIVGSRKASPYGVEAARNLAGSLAGAGLAIVSGLAYGIDEAAHQATVQAGGVTVSVLASGLLNLTSRQGHLARKIIEHGGAVLSEFPLHAPGLRHHFPYRNRVISGLSHGTLIIEAAEKSGSLITARCALEQNREVFTVPGPITSPTSEGTNNLLKMGAHPVTSASDVLDVLNVEHTAQTEHKPKPDSKEEAVILDLLTKAPIHIDELTRQTELNAPKVASTLSLMEMKGRTRHVGGQYYILC